MGTRILGRLKHLSAGYQGRRVLNDITLDITEGRQLAVLGPSGTGKSTLLRVLLGELQPSAGELDFPSGRPRAALVSQQPWLFDWLTVGENIASGLKFRVNRDVAAPVSHELLELVGLAEVANSYPDQLSGGQAQRASLARALAVAPDWLLLDEPFSALDPAIRSELQTWLRATTSRDALTTIVVTHDIDEALILADDIVVLGQQGSIRAQFTNEAPATDAVAAHRHPLRSQIRASYSRMWEPGDEEFSGVQPLGA